MAQHLAIPQFSMALGDLTAMFARLAKDRPVSLFWIDVNRASHLFGFRIRNQSNVNGEVRITTALNGWLAHLVEACPPRLKLSGSGGDEVLVVDEGEDQEGGLAAVRKLILAAQEATVFEGVPPRVTMVRSSLTMACGGIRAEQGSAGYGTLESIMTNVRQAKVVGTQGSLNNSAICWMGANTILPHPDDVQDDE